MVNKHKINLNRDDDNSFVQADGKATLTRRYLVDRQERIQRFLKEGVLCVGHHGWPVKKILDFRWSKKAEVTLETITFWQNISINIFKFSPFLSIKSYQLFKIY